jgi:hypothetical protein
MYGPAAGSGQRWRSSALPGRGMIAEVEPGLHGIDVEPSVGIGQTALLVHTTSGNLLWDPNGYVDDELVAAVWAG